THAHLDFPELAGELEAVLARAADAGVTRVITVGTSLEGSRRAVELAHRNRNVFAAIGVHPGNALDAPEDIIGPLRELARHPKVVAIGECGLDYHRLPGKSPLVDALDAIGTTGAEMPGDAAGAVRDGAIRAAQAAVFEQQLDLAVELGLNVVVHERDAWSDTVAMLAPFAGKLRAVFHCFGKSIEQARGLIDLGHLVSFTGIVTFKNAQVVQQTAAQIPGDAFMVETDCPYLAPVPHRGKRCEPAHTRLVAEKIATLRNESLDELAASTTQTAERFFRFPR
ncbi:MAG TPA: TatD family hydrolase, partial [Chthoniobacteraceae bacterium]|nr:TatD family hydrolase [Chthoniobacteraceae bacterium]